MNHMLKVHWLKSQKMSAKLTICCMCKMYIKYLLVQTFDKSTDVFHPKKYISHCKNRQDSVHIIKSKGTQCMLYTAVLWSVYLCFGTNPQVLQSRHRCFWHNHREADIDILAQMQINSYLLYSKTTIWTAKKT